MKRVLIVDDSSVFRSEIRRALMGEADIEVVGTAANGALALEALAAKNIELMILDVEMPEMNGLTLLEEMDRKGIRLPVIMFAGATKSSALMALKCLNRGASDFVVKPFVGESGKAPSEAIREALLPKIRSTTFAKSHSIQGGVLEKRKVNPEVQQKFNVIDWKTFRPEAIVIGSSTGGPRTLEQVFKAVGPEQHCPIFIVQHMPPVFTAALAEHLSEASGLKVVEARQGQPVNSKTVYVAPGDYHMLLRRDSNGVCIELNQNPQRHSVRPAVDYLFESASEVYMSHLLGMVLTGMGEDGKLGAIRIKQVGGAMIIQEPSSCVVYGMPRAVHESGAFDLELDPAGCRDKLMQFATQMRRSA